MTHRELTRAAASWLIRGRNCFASAWEVGVAGGGQYDAIGVTAPDPAADTVIRCREYDIARAGFDRKYEARLARKHKQRPGPLFDGLAPTPSPVTERRIHATGSTMPRIEVVECKATRSDWLADIRVGKLRRYEPAASHAWLWTTPDVGALDTLVADGLPDAWGVVAWDGRSLFPSILRDATTLREPEQWEVVGMAAIMLRSLSWRGTGNGPTADELDLTPPPNRATPIDRSTP